jgi:iron(III) transport system substrate-binding protein
MTIGALGLALGLGAGVAAAAAGGELNIYSARHYQTDEALYERFARETGIRINRIEDSGEKLMVRLKNEGANSPADVLVTVDAGNLWRADEAGLFQAVRSAVLEERIPKHLRHPDGRWFGFSTRARVIVFDKAAVKDPAQLARYEDLADPRWKGKVCIRSSANVYNLSLMASLIHHLGEAGAEAWARGAVANFARDPKGGDTDQIKAVAAGECQVGLANTYYYARLLKSAKDKAVAEKVGVVFPNQRDRGAHVNVSGAGVLKHAPNKANAIRFLEYLAGDFAQTHFAGGNNEYPVAATAQVDPALASLGEFKADTIGVEVLGSNQPLAQKIYDRAGWK